MASSSPLASTRTETTGRISKTVGYYAAFIVLGLITGVFGPALPDLARHTQTTLNQISIIFVVRSLGYLAGSMLSGRWFDSVPGHPVFAVVLLTAAVTFVLIPTVPLLGLLIAIMLLLGIAEGSLDVGGNSLLVWVHGARVGPFMNGLHFFFGVGAFISPIVIAQVVLATGDIRWAFTLLAGLMVPIALVFLRLPSPPIQHASAQTETPQVNYQLVVMIAAMLFVYVGVETGYGNWVFTYATRLALANATDAALLTSTFWGSFTLGRLLGVAISTRAKPAVIIFFDLLGTIVSVAIVTLLPQSSTALWLGTIGAGLCMASIFPAVLAYAGQRLTITARVTGWFLVGGGLGAMFFPWLVGQLIEPIGASAMTFIVLGSVIIDLALLGAIVFAPKPITR